MAETTALRRAPAPSDDGTSQPEAGSSALPPMPKRVADTTLTDLAPDEAVAKLLARAARLVEQLQTDVAELAADRQEEHTRIEAEWAQLEEALRSAKGRLGELTTEAREIASNKARLDDLERALATPPRLDDGVSFLDVAATLEHELKLAHGITGAIRLPAIGRLLGQAALAIEQLAAASEQTRQRLLSQSTEAMYAEGTEARASFDIGLGVLERDLELLTDALPLAARPWSHTSWGEWTPPSDITPWLRVGDHVHDELADIRVPMVVSADDGAGLLFEPGPRRDDVVAGVQSLLLRIIAAYPPGGVRFVVVDPKGLGDSVAPLLPLAEYEPDLLSGGVKTLEGEIEEQLGDLVRHIESVTKRYLQGRFESLAEYQESIGEIVEPARYLVAFDHPTGLSERGATLLRTIVESGARAGVHAVIVKDPKPAWQPPATRTLPGLRLFKVKDNAITTETPWGPWKVDLDAHDRSDSQLVAHAERIIDEVGRHARDLVAAPLSQARLFAALRERQRRRDDLDAAIAAVEPEHPSTWWAADAGEGISVPLGTTGEREPLTLRFDAHEPGVFVAGGSDREIASALDAIVTGIAMVYAPTEVQLLMVGFGPNEGFSRYGASGLPHARLVATRSERDVAVSLLETLDGEIDRRLSRFRSEGCERTGLDAYRRASGRRLSRIVLVVDGVGELLRSGDRMAQRAERLLSRLALEGPPLGLHVVLSERLQRENMDVLVRAGDLFSTRLLLVDELDALGAFLPDGVVSDDFDREPTRAVVVRGETALGLRPVCLDAQERASCLRELRHLADQRGVVGRPQVLHGDDPASLEHAPLGLLAAGAGSQGLRLKPRAWLGEPMGLGPPVEVLLRREPANNVLIVGPSGIGEGVLLAMANSAALSQGEYLDLRVVDLTPIEDGFGELLAELDERIDVRVTRRQSAPRVLDEVTELVNGRRTTNDYRSRPVLLLLAGVPDWSDDTIAARLLELLREGPAVGVHVGLWAGGADTCVANLGPEVLAQFGYRVVGPMSGDESSALIETDAAASLRPAHGYFYDESRARLVKFRPYAAPRAGWHVSGAVPSDRMAGTA